MASIEKMLMPNEQIKFQTTLNTFTFIFWLVANALVGLAFALLTPFITVIFFFVCVGIFIKYKTSAFVVTNRRVLIKVGLFNRRSVEMLLTKIESIGFDQSIFDRIANMGTVSIVGSGGSIEKFRGIQNPEEFKRQIQIQTDNSDQNRNSTSA